MTTRHTVESTRANRQRSTEYLPSCANRHPLWRIVISCNESFDSSRIVSNRQHFLHCMVQKILKKDLQSFRALRTWEVHVFLCKSTSGMRDRHLLWRVVRFESNRVESCRIVKICYTVWFRNSDDRLPVVSCFKNVGGLCLPLQIDIRCDGSSFTVTSRSIRVESCRIVNIC